MKHFVLTALACLLLLGAKTQTPSFSTSGDIYLGLRKLNVLGSVLYIAAHPDDENTRLLTYFSKEKLYRTGYLSITRGDGGQNLIGDEQGIELGLIRTQELLSARRIDGAEQFFTRAFDFGYSKSPQETFAKWDKEKILSDVVWVIRKFQPDVIITRFPTTGEGGHGHHTASAILAFEAFSVAADPKRFPEQLQYVQPWQAKRILWNGFVPGGGNATGNDFFRIDVGGFNPLLGKSYGEIASESRSQHKSQGFGVARGRGEAIENFRTLAGEAPTNDLFDGINTSISKAVNNKSWQEIQKQIDDLNARFDFLAPQKSVPSLVKLYSLLQPQLSANNPWILQKNKEVRDLILACSGLWIEAFTNVPSVTQGDSLQISVVLNNRLGQPITVRKITEATQTDVWHKQFDTILPKNKNFIFSQKVKLLPNSAITQPHWLEQKMTEGYYNVSSQLLIGTPDARPAGTVDVLMKIGDDLIQFGDFPIRYKFTDPVKGELYQPLAILPKIEFNYTNENYFLFDRQAVSVPVQFKSNKNDSTQYQFEHLFSKNWTSRLPQFGYSPSVGVDNNAIAKFSPAKN
ncbi:MAG: PIG-L family deacetylase, partial [Chitinophagaceae bacterium]